jgi:hypothetical protein
VATQVLKAYVDKQRRAPQKLVEKPKSDGKVDIGALWSGPEGDKLEGGRFVLDLPKRPVVAAASAVSSTKYLLPSTPYAAPRTR